MLWVVKNMADQGHTPRQRHYWWRQVLGLQADDTGVDDHLFLSEIMEEAACFDQINVSELMFMERIARRYQMWEQMYASALRKAEAGSSSGAWLDEREIFLGNERSRGHALICPDLEKWVAARLAEESAVLKERRKGREERQLASGFTIEEIHSPGNPAADTGGGRGRGRGKKNA